MLQHSFSPSVSMRKGPKLVNAKDLFFLRIILINVLLWMAIWNLAEHVVEYLEEKTKIHRFHLYVSIMIICVVFILIDIELFESL